MGMKLFRVCLAITVLVLASLACQAVTGGGSDSPTLPPGNENTNPEVPQSTLVSPATSNTDNITNTDFPITADAYNVTEAGGSLIFYTKLSLEETLKFYRDEYASKGYAEREILTQVSDGTFSIVFDGDSSGQAVVVQSVDLGDGSRTVSIRLEDV
jgi:hypothetical protein